jgi:hypothetical protein
VICVIAAAASDLIVGNNELLYYYSSVLLLLLNIKCYMLDAEQRNIFDLLNFVYYLSFRYYQVPVIFNGHFNFRILANKAQQYLY